jgi:hypothetical protein
MCYLGMLLDGASWHAAGCDMCHDAECASLSLTFCWMCLPGRFLDGVLADMILDTVRADMMLNIALADMLLDKALTDMMLDKVYLACY